MKAPLLNGSHKCFASLDLGLERHDIWVMIKAFHRIHLWSPIVTHAYGIDEKEQGVGAKRHCRIKGLADVDEEITYWQEGYGFAYKSSPFSVIDDINASWWLTPLNDKLTRINLELSYQVKTGTFNYIYHALLLRKKLEAIFPHTLRALSEKLIKQKLIRPLRLQTLSDSAKATH